MEETSNIYSIDYYKSQMGLLLNREKELQETQRHLQRMVSTLISLQKISRFLKASSNLDEGLTYALRALVTETNYERAVVVLEQGDTVHVIAQGGYSVDEKQALAGITKAQLEEFLATARATHDSVFLIGPEDRRLDGELLPLLQFDTCLLATISDSEGSIGFIAAGYSPAQAVYFAPALDLKRDDTVWFDELAHQISAAIVNLTLLDNLQAERARLLASINSLNMGFMIVDPAHHVLFSNKAASTTLGIDHIASSHDVEEKLTEVRVTQLGEQALIEGSPVEVPEVLYGKKILRLFFGPVAKDAHVIGYIFLVEDITEAKSVERTREEFFSIASHELRTPLTAIMGNASMLLRYYAQSLSDPNARSMVEDTESAAKRLIKLVDDFLLVSRLEQHKAVFQMTSVDVAALVQDVVRDLQPSAEAKKIGLTYAAPEGSIQPVKADPEYIKKVLANLINNGIGFTREGGVVVSIVSSANGVTVKVTDTGVGIPQQNQSLLFRKFQQAGDILARENTQSSGLGLYISKLIVEGMQGSITLDESVPDKGSVFSFTLPAA